jgi:hypothetical protein
VTGSSGFLHLSWGRWASSKVSSLRLDDESSGMQPVDSILEAKLRPPPGAYDALIVVPLTTRETGVLELLAGFTRMRRSRRISYCR